ncbi:hypothetical protein C498_12398 [Haloferax volcanii DS2]|uniref:Uncharacterized protein n=1 Tax=Haloferax volcanii (strain ATCC 29605 / DSM 3757 / JCM 8879 / NBRC 14742 / NCIMB 2012 / VKM B-1768 / DS2) TaxID=309800 RepID=L9UT13_HALVD|nr:hypothetical protein C498_12398 [Haloferax volcanii DS2]
MSSSSPSSRSGGWPRSVGYDRSTLVVLSAELNAETASITSSGSSVVVIVAAGLSWDDRAPTNTVWDSSNESTVSSGCASTVTAPSTRRYVLTAPKSSMLYVAASSSSRPCWSTCASIDPASSRTQTTVFAANPIRSVSMRTAASVGSENRRRSVGSGATDDGVRSMNWWRSMLSRTTNPVPSEGSEKPTSNAEDASARWSCPDGSIVST